jgi:hypothetical protein
LLAHIAWRLIDITRLAMTHRAGAARAAERSHRNRALRQRAVGVLACTLLSPAARQG